MRYLHLKKSVIFQGQTKTLPCRYGCQRNKLHAAINTWQPMATKNQGNLTTMVDLMFKHMPDNPLQR